MPDHVLGGKIGSELPGKAHPGGAGIARADDGDGGAIEQAGIAAHTKHRRRRFEVGEQ